MGNTNYLKKIPGTRPDDSAGLSQSNLYDIIFKDCFFSIKRFILSHGGEEDDLNDILQDTFLVLTTKVPEEKLREAKSIQAYTFGISRNLWLKELERKKVCENSPADFIIPDEADDENDFYTDLQQRYNLYWKHFIRLGQECRKIIQAFIKKIETKEMSDKFGYTTDNYYKRKSICLKSLQTKIKQDPMYNRLKTT
jgi:DNA-directed RNA polymerase specialized sigma24 family protein